MNVEKIGINDRKDDKQRINRQKMIIKKRINSNYI